MRPERIRSLPFRNGRLRSGQWWAAAAGVVFVCAGVAAAVRAPEPEPVSRDTPVFGIRADSVSGLYPGAVRRSRVTLLNPYPYPIVVRSVDAQVASTSRRRCRASARNLRVERFHGRLPVTVPARGRAVAGEFEVHMPGTVDDACRRATFRLTVTGTARTVGR
ncbi:hypothetical protein ACWT_7508 [Actinoplanes sp. SE50]|uniref:hypothetical protein n=1 Tax=unclassified Actinoplanes TaxID=2626549 RepID=UPI00023EDCAF|nr:MULTISPECIES: hypothetical protein [unclassified Actinoplanes]AEV88518.1 hypothetical protein ACPL_7638 [Actinoplanes sp. SE50/110]ATO86923.1 hypothetical protein ACWT_7508 [Actinoplanes sp. SE50]SLM04341.1 hypothetical protein ACSP50_7646 [Actinoplanes sp. SE50/110]